MKQCPTCNRTYANDKQKFCTQDGVALVDAHSASAGQGETVRIDSAELDDEITKAISKGLPRMTGSGFDPYKTTVSAPQETSAIPSQETEAPRAQAPAPPPVPLDQVAAAPVAPPPVAPPAQAPAAPPPPVTLASPATNVPPAQVAAAGPVTPPARPPKKRSKLPLILGILFVLLLLGAGAVVAGYFFVLKPMLEAKRGAIVEPRHPKPTPVVATTPDVGKTKPEVPKTEPPPYSPPANAVQFVNSNANLTGKLAEHYVDFSFYYPKPWQKDPKSGVAGATNFVRVERSLPPNYTLENFAVGWYSSAGSAEADRTTFARLAENLSAKFEKTIDNYRKVSEQETKIGPYDAYEFRFAGRSQPTDKGQFEIWGVAVFVPPVDGGKDGVTLLMLATSLAPELTSVNDVGVKGQLPMMLESFRFGK